MKTKKIIWFIPFIALFVLSLVSLFIYLFAFGGRAASVIAAACVAPFTALVIPFLNGVLKFKIPFGFSVAVAVFAFAAIDLATVLNFYSLVPYYDKMLHTCFGFLGAMGAFIILLHGDGRKMKGWCFFLMIFLSVLGVAALWEVYEYAVGAIFNTNTQNWRPDLNEVGGMTVREFFETYHPLTDTMWDIIVAAFGVLVFFGAVFIDKHCGYKMCKSLNAGICGNEDITTGRDKAER